MAVSGTIPIALAACRPLRHYLLDFFCLHSQGTYATRFVGVVLATQPDSRIRPVPGAHRRVQQILEWHGTPGAVAGLLMGTAEVAVFGNLSSAGAVAEEAAFK